MGGRPPEPFLQGEEALRARITRDIRRRLRIAPDDRSDEALRAIEDALDAEMEAVADPVDVEATLARVESVVFALVQHLHIEAHSAPVVAVAVTPNGTWAISASLDGTLKLWDSATGGLLSIFQGDDGPVRAVAIAPDGERAISGSDDHMLKVWDLEARTLLTTLQGHSGAVRAVAVTPDGQRAISGADDRTVRIWDLATGKLLATFEGHSDAVGAVAVTPDGRHAISGSDDRTLKIWDLAAGSLLATLEGHGDAIRAVAVTPDGQRAISGSDDGKLEVWDLATRRPFVWAQLPDWAIDPLRLVGLTADQIRKLVAELSTIEAEGASVSGVAVTPDGKHAISVSSDRTLRLWNLQTRAELARFGADSELLCCATAPGGRIVAAGDAAGHVHLLEITP